MSGSLPLEQSFASSFSPEMLATVFESSIKGQTARGVDGQTPELFLKSIEGKYEGLSAQILSGKFGFTRFKEKLILKGANRAPRQVFIPTVRDRLVLRCLHEYLSGQFPEAMTPLPHACIKAIALRLKKATADESLLRVDIKNFYPSVIHLKLFNEVKSAKIDKNCLELVRRAIKTTAEKNRKSRRGIPQGLSVSNCLANIAILKIDAELRAKFGEDSYFRYVDDVVAITKSATSVADFAAIALAFKKTGLTVHKLSEKGKSTSKSQICSISEGVEYLGFRLKPSIISIRPASLKKMYDRIASQMTALKYGRSFPRVAYKIDLMISGCVLNGKRYGWLHFFQQSEDTSQLVNLDRFVKMLSHNNPKVPNSHKFKTFIKAYHEIRFRSATTKYIPNFDEANLDFKKDILRKFGFVANLDTMLIEEIDAIFSPLVSKMAHELEKDVLQVAY